MLQHNATKCFKNNNENWECTSRLATGVGPHGNMTVVYAYDDSHTPDGRPLGIITAYYKNDSGCFAAKDIETKCP